MYRKKGSMCLFLLVFVSSVNFCYGQIEIVDPNLRKAVESALGKESGDLITKAEMETLTSLDANNLGISDLSGIEYAINFKNLQARSNLISDLSPLSKLDMVWLVIPDNKIQDVSLLSEMVSLGELNIEGNQISDISALSNLTNLWWLFISRTPISDISVLSNLVNLEWLSISHTNVIDISVLSNMSKLRHLDANHTKISDLSPLSDLSILNRLDLIGTQVSDVSALSNLTNLEWLDLGITLISDVSDLSDLTKLKVLSISHTFTSDISAVSSLIELEQLNLESTLVSDVSALSNLTELMSLNLSRNQITDISALSSLTNLRKLYLNNNSISDISPLVENTGLESGDVINLHHNNLSYLSLYEYIPALQSRGVEVYFDDNKRLPTTLKKVSDDPLIVVVRDENGVAYEGVPVDFAITEGNGLIEETIFTDKNGRARAVFECNSSTGFNTISASVVGIGETLTFNVINELGFGFDVPSGINFIHIPLKITEVNGVSKTIETVGALHDVFGGNDFVNFIITYDYISKRWISYFGIQDRNKSSDRVLTDDLGLIVSLKKPVSLRLYGFPLGVRGHSLIALCPGLNLLGIPLNDSRIVRVSDIFKLEGIMDNVSIIMVYDENRIKVVTRVDDDGDISIKGGQSFMLIASKSSTIDLKGGGWSNAIEEGLRFLDELLSD